MRLTKEEKEIRDSVERGEWKRIPNSDDEATRYQEAARATLRRDKRINIRITQRDFVRVQKKALEEGLPY